MADDPDPKPPIEQPKPAVRPKEQMVPQQGAHLVPSAAPKTARITLSSQTPLGVQEHSNVLLQAPVTLQLGIQFAGRTEILAVTIDEERTRIRLLEAIRE
ncbi:MAG: hypothetical protein K0U16_07590 [Gammaproteobacteria bacterium]|nr:hypothetical protein [Gammaproteobacteria bacterium]